MGSKLNLSKLLESDRTRLAAAFWRCLLIRSSSFVFISMDCVAAIALNESYLVYFDSKKKE